MCSCGCWEATTHGACLADPDERHRLEMAGGGRATHALKFCGEKRESVMRRLAPGRLKLHS